MDGENSIEFQCLKYQQFTFIRFSDISLRFGVDKQVPSNIVLNYIGVALIIVSAIFNLFVKTDAKIKTDVNTSPETGVLGIGQIILS